MTLTSDLKRVLEPLEAVCGESHLALTSARRRAAAVLQKRMYGERAECGAAHDEWSAALVLLLRLSHRVWEVQRVLLGHQHPECASTLFDIKSVLSEMISHDTRALSQLAIWSKPLLASHAERRARELYDALTALYDITPLRHYFESIND